MKSGLSSLYEGFKSDKGIQEENANLINKYSRRKLAGDMVGLLNEMIEKETK